MRGHFSYKTEKKKLEEIFEGLSEDDRRISESLIHDAAFLAEELEKLRKIIAEEGWTEQWQNGENQFGSRQSSTSTAYIQALKTYTSIIKQLKEFLGKRTETAKRALTLADLMGDED